MNSDQIEELFQLWWAESFPGAPVNKQSRQVCCAFAAHVLDVGEVMAEYECSPLSLN